MPSSTFTDALAALEREISNKLFHGYGPRTIPHELDRSVERFVKAYLAADHTEHELLNCLPKEACPVLLAFAERQAAQAIRTKSQEPLAQSLIAAGLSVEISDDEQGAMLVLPLPWHCADMLTNKPKVLFKQASLLLPEKGRQALLDFCQRTPKDQTLSCMGYAAGADEDGFRYVRAW